MATTSDLRKGMLIRYNGALQRVVDFQHISPGNWRAMVRLRLKNFKTGGVTEDRVRAGSDLDIIPTETRTAQFLYKDGSSYFFMDTESFDQIELSEEDVAERMQFIRENENVDLLVIHEDGQSSVIDVAPPNFVTLKVTEADVAVRGDTSTNIKKSVTLETGAVIQAPAFIKEGDLLRIDTRSGEYVERAKS
ncbi:MAG: elongation factor P [Caldilineaceae bacterium]